MQSTVLLLNLFGIIGASAIDQQPLANPTEQINGISMSSGLHGRFLHITDFHPDGYYKRGASIEDGSCHRGKGVAGYFGQEGSDCDSPYILVNETFRWIEENLKDKIDFVIWTGDSARHDNDERNPRTDEEIIQANEFMAEKWISVLGRRENSRLTGVPRVPVVPSFGNNDIAPHNIFMPGPNRWTKKFAGIWHDFIPEAQKHSFVTGGWFVSEVIPGSLVVISLNTMYFFDSNSAVDGCSDKSEPGYEHMEWLRVQLEVLRTRNMKAILMGHVPPSRTKNKRNWDESCWQKYALWMDRYRDVVVGSLYGHMNIDHFMLQDHRDVDVIAQKSTGDELSTTSKADYVNELRHQWSKLPSPPKGIFKCVDAEVLDDETLDDEFADYRDSDDLHDQGKKRKKGKKTEKEKFLKKIGGPWAERYSVSLVPPSLVPVFFPTLRIMEYNITGLKFDDKALTSLTEETKEMKKQPHFTVPQPPSPASPPGPAYSNQPLTWLSYTQYYANITRINKDADHKKKEPRLEFEVEYSTTDDVYQMEDLTVRSFFGLAVRIGRKGKASSNNLSSDTEMAKKKNRVNRTWSAFLSRAFTGLLDVDDLDNDN